MNEVTLDPPVQEPLSSGRASTATTLGVWYELAKPRITRMVVLTTALGMFASKGPRDFVKLFATLVGMALVVAGANALNMFLERDSDGLMSRTSGRPLPSGRARADEVLALGVAWSLLGLIVMAHFSGVLAFGLAAFSLLSYVLVYTPLKRVGPIALYVGAVPGALPPAIGYVSASGHFDAFALSLFLILFVWQLPHFLAITLFRSGEYERAGLRVMPVVSGAHRTRVALFAFSVALLAVTLLPMGLGLVQGGFYLSVAVISGVLFVATAAYGLFKAVSDRWARTIFFASMPHLILVMGSLVASA
jgi:heme o synthase